MSDAPSLLQTELRQRRPFRSRSQEAVLGMMRTVDVLKRVLEKVVAPYGITLQQYNVLRILRGAGEEGIPTLSIAERMIEETPGITRLLDRLEAKGLVRRERCPSDRRQVLCYLSPAGSELVESLDQPVDEADDQVLAMLPEADQKELVRMLDAIRAAYRGKAGPA